jgi:hypothetical protein
MDRGYLDFSRLYQLAQACAYFVVRAKPIFSAAEFTLTPSTRAVDYAAIKPLR